MPQDVRRCDRPQGGHHRLSHKARAAAFSLLRDFLTQPGLVPTPCFASSGHALVMNRARQCGQWLQAEAHGHWLTRLCSCRLASAPASRSPESEGSVRAPWASVHVGLC